MFYEFCHGVDCWWKGLEYTKLRGCKDAPILNIYQILLFKNVHLTKNLCFRIIWCAYVFTTNDLLSSYGKAQFNHRRSLQFQSKNKITLLMNFDMWWNWFFLTNYSFQRSNILLKDFYEWKVCGSNYSLKSKDFLNIVK